MLNPRFSWPFYITVFLGAFLLFQVQPMLSKALLPGFGGSYLVWGAAMVFFQGVLLLGYGFTHFVQRRPGTVPYARLHPFLLLLPLLWLPFRFDRLAPSPDAGLPMVIEVLRLLAVVAGAPFFMVSMTAVIVQRWLSVHPAFHDRNPYVLYSASNLGSLLALLTYPVLVEPFFTLQQQATGWAIAYTVLAGLHLFCLPRPFAAAQRLAERGRQTVTVAAALPRASRREVAAWFMLSSAACAFLLAVTNVLTFDVAAVPFLWILPLSVYLGTFVLAFRPVPWFPAWMRPALLWAVPLGVVIDWMTPFRITPLLLPALAVHLVILFIVCLNTHAALARRKPRNPDQLTAFYLIIALGGFCGGMAVSWLVPLLTTRLAEYLGAIILCMAALALAEEPVAPLVRGRTRRRLLPLLTAPAGALLTVTLLTWLARNVWHLDGLQTWIATALPLLLILRAAGRHTVRLVLTLLVILAVSGRMESFGGGDTAILRLRNYYGIYRIFDRDGQRYLQHGTTLHGRQYLDESRSRIPGSYFHPTTPAAILLTDPALRFENIGMTGLGTGALAAYAGDGQSFIIFEIDADNVWIAERYFTYLEQARRQGAALEIRVGDGRLLMRENPPASFDLLIIDAFSSGSIPVHLITVEAFREYFRILRPNGLILLHISNRMLNLEPLLFSIARQIGVRAASADNAHDIHPDAEPTLWMALFNDDGTPEVSWLLPHLKRHAWRRDAVFSEPLPPPWTDRYSNLLRILQHGN